MTWKQIQERGVFIAWWSVAACACILMLAVTAWLVGH